MGTTAASFLGSLPRLAVAAALGLVLGCGGGGGSSALDPAPLPTDPAVLSMTFVGDTCGHGLVMDASAADPLADVGDLLPDADVLVLNHEGVLVAPPHAPGECEPLPGNTLLDAHAHMADFLRRAPVTVATLANNHVSDCGDAGLLATRTALESRGLLVCGAGDDAEAACAPRRFQVNGVDVAVLAYLAYPAPDVYGVTAGQGQPGVATWDACDGARQVAALAAEGAYVVVCLHLHLGPSGTSITWPQDRAVVERALDAGAALVVAHGPHVPQGVLVRGRQVALFSLGNFLFSPGYDLAPGQRDVVTATVSLHAQSAVVTLRAGRLDDQGRPAPTDADTRREILGHVADLSGEGTALSVVDDRAYVVVPR